MMSAQPQAVYAKVQRRAERSAMFSDVASATSSTSSSTTANSNNNLNLNNNSGGSHPATSSGSNSNKDVSKLRTFHVTLYKDTVYDDYGFSLSDGLYERGVFINRIRSGGPADVVGLLKSFDRIMQVSVRDFCF